MVTVLVVDDLFVVREGIKGILARDPEVEVAGEASSLPEALLLVEAGEYDVVFLDLEIGGIDSVSFIKQVRSNNAAIRFILFARESDPARVMKALEAGATGYITRSAGPDEIKRAVHQIHDRGSYLDNRSAALVLGRIQASKTKVAERALTDQDRFILTCLAQGLNNSEIADRLSVSVSTVKTHLRTLYRKFSTTDRTLLALRALKEGYVEEYEDAAAAGRISFD